MPIFFTLALMLRLVVSLTYHHADADVFYHWGDYLWRTKDFIGFIGKSAPNATEANYPPVYYYLLYLSRFFHQLVGDFLWFLNTRLALFPSTLIPFYLSKEVVIAFNKIPGIVADLGCAAVIYRLIGYLSPNKRSSVLSRAAVLVFLFFPGYWYLSSYWGQIESVYGFFALLGVYYLLRSKFILAMLMLVFSGLVKPTGLFVLPVFFLYAWRKKAVLDMAVGLLLSFMVVFVLYFPFWPLKTITNLSNYYLSSLQGVFGYVTANAFNYWALVYGFEPLADSVLLAGVRLSIFGWLVFGLLVLVVLTTFWKSLSDVHLIYAAFLISLAAFLFLTRMHERYYFLGLIFAAVLGGRSKRWFWLFVGLSLVYTLNLYHQWWYPRVDLLVDLLSSDNLIRVIIIANLSVFAIVFINFCRRGLAHNNR